MLSRRMGRIGVADITQAKSITALPLACCVNMAELPKARSTSKAREKKDNHGRSDDYAHPNIAEDAELIGEKAGAACKPKPSP